MKEIILTQGKVALVDDEDYEYLGRFKWNAYRDKTTWYARRYAGNYRNITMHREILGFDADNSGLVCDHIDHNGLNNQRSNLRIATKCENQANKKKNIGRSKHLGVFRNKSEYKGKVYIYWQAAICKNGIKEHLGCFKSEEEAAIAYNNRAKELHGEFANLNQV